MALYFITYDLRNVRDYKLLYDALSDFAAVRVLESTWCFRRIHTNTLDLVNYFRQFIDADDGLLIVESIDWVSWLANGTPNDLQ